MSVDKLSKVIETVPEIYNDVAQPTAKELGKTLSLLPRTINAALTPVRKWVAQREYNLAETEKLLAIKLNNIGLEKIVSPEPYVAVPALQAISYSMDNAELRNLYANLLAKSMNIDTKETVHPSFVETIKQLSPEDAILFKYLCSINVRPLIDVHLKLNTKGNYLTLAKNFNLFNILTYAQQQLSIDNLIRQRLIDIPQYISYGNTELYNETEIQAKQIYFVEPYIARYPESKIEFNHSRIDITSYGDAFHNICILDK
jgi:hypothetical protein